MTVEWNKKSWRKLPIRQQPKYNEIDKVIKANDMEDEVHKG